MVSNAVTSLTVTATVSDTAASIKINETTVPSGTASAPINLNVGANTITVVVTAANGTTKTYSIVVTRSIRSR